MCSRKKQPKNFSSQNFMKSGTPMFLKVPNAMETSVFDGLNFLFLAVVHGNTLRCAAVVAYPIACFCSSLLSCGLPRNFRLRALVFHITVLWSQWKDESDEEGQEEEEQQEEEEEEEEEETKSIHHDCSMYDFQLLALEHMFPRESAPDHTPAKSPNKKRCAVCWGRTYWHCPTCNVPLHVQGQCWNAHHCQ